MKRSEKVGAGAGAATGFGGGMWGMLSAISALGTPGLSGAGILSGLATLGSTVVGGIVVTAGATVVAAGACAYGGYRAVKWCNS